MMDKRVESMQVSVDIQDGLRRQRDDAVRLLEEWMLVNDPETHERAKYGTGVFLANLKEG